MPSMTLQFSITKAKFIFVSWQSETIQQFILGCCCTAFLAFLMMSCQEFRRRALRWTQKRYNQKHSIITATQNNIIETEITEQNLNKKQKAISTIIYLIYALLHLLLMIVIMWMNFWVILSIIFGAAFGYCYSESNKIKRDKKQCCVNNDENKESERKGEWVEETQMQDEMA